MKKILVAYDGTPGAEAALKEIIHAGFPQQAEAKVFTAADVWLPPSTPEGKQSDDPHYVASHEKATEALREAGRIAMEGARRVHELFPGWNVSNGAQADSPAWGILAEAKRWGADIVVIGSHGRNPLEKFFLGSISFKVAAEADHAQPPVSGLQGGEPRDRVVGTAVIDREHFERPAECVEGRGELAVELLHVGRLVTHRYNDRDLWPHARDVR